MPSRHFRTGRNKRRSHAECIQRGAEVSHHVKPVGPVRNTPNPPTRTLTSKVGERTPLKWASSTVGERQALSPTSPTSPATVREVTRVCSPPPPPKPLAGSPPPPQPVTGSPPSLNFSDRSPPRLNFSDRQPPQTAFQWQTAPPDCISVTGPSAALPSVSASLPDCDSVSAAPPTPLRVPAVLSLYPCSVCANLAQSVLTFLSQ